MARTLPRASQLRPNTLKDAIVAADAAIQLSKLENGTRIAVKNVDGTLNVAAAANGTEAVNLNQLNAAVGVSASGLDGKASVRLAYNANVDIATGGLLTQGTVTLVAGDRVLLMGQTDPIQNGIYVAAAGAWARAEDADGTPANELSCMSYTYVEEGTFGTNGYYLVTPDPIVVGTTAQQWSIFAGPTAVQAGDGLEKVGQVLNVLVDDNTIEFSIDNELKIKELGVQAGHVNASVAGAGIVKNGTSGALDVNVDDSTVEINADVVRVKDLGIGKAKINSDVAGNGIEKAAGGELAVKLDPTTSTALTVGAAGLKLTLPDDLVTNAKVVTREPAAGVIDGVNVTFTLAYVPVEGSECVYLNGILLDEGAGNDYTINYATRTITFEFPPEVNDKLRVNYIVA